MTDVKCAVCDGTGRILVENRDWEMPPGIEPCDECGGEGKKAVVPEEPGQ